MNISSTYLLKYLQFLINKEGKNKKLTKMNISQQSAKYTENGKAITRPTIDSYKNIVEYIQDKKDIKKNNTEALLKEIERLTQKNKELEETVKTIKEYADGVAQENFRLSEELKHH